MPLFGLAKFAVKKAAKPSIYIALLSSVIWLGVDLADGASERFHSRFDQAKTSVVEPTEQFADKTHDVLMKLWHSIETNPGPSILAIALFVVTVIYHKRKGASALEAVKATILKTSPAEPENPLLAKMQQQALESQMLETHERLETRSKTLPTEIFNARGALTQRSDALNRANESQRRAQDEYNKASAYHQKLVQEQLEATSTMIELEKELAKA